MTTTLTATESNPPDPIIGIQAVTEVTTIAALRALEGPSSQIAVRTLGYYSAGDGGGGLFYWDSTSSATHNGGTIIAPDAGGTGRWRAILGEDLPAARFGVNASQSAATNTTRLQAVWDYVESVTNPPEVVLPEGIININAPTYIDKGASEAQVNISIRGAGRGTVLTATTATTSGLSTRLQPARVSGAPGTDTDSYNVAAILIVMAPNSANARNFRIRGVRFNATGAAIDTAIGIFAPRIALSSFRDLWFENLAEGMQVRNFYLCDFQNVDFRDCVYPLRHNRTAGDNGGTSVTMQHVSSYCDHGWEFDNLTYSHFSGVTAEAWTSGNYAWKFANRSIVTLDGCGAEGGLGGGFNIEGAAATSYASATIGGRTMVTCNGGNFSFGNAAVTVITDFGVANEAAFSFVKRDATLLLNRSLLLQEYNGTTAIDLTAVYDNAQTTLIPEIKIDEAQNFGLTAANLDTSGTTPRTRLTFWDRGVKKYGANSTNPPCNKVIARLTKTGNQAFSSGTPAKLTFASSPAFYFDPQGGLNGSVDGWTAPCCGIYRVRAQVKVQAVPTTDALEIYIKNGGSTWAFALAYGNAAADQVIVCEGYVPVFTAGTDITVECARRTATVTVIGDANANQVLIELI